MVKIYFLNSTRPEKRSLETKHENIITLLNDQMAHKASSQIKLNETRDLLRELNQTVKKKNFLIFYQSLLLDF